MLFVRGCALVLAAMIPLSSAEARSHATAKALTRLFRQPVDSAWFATAFLSQVPANRVADIISQPPAATAACARSPAATTAWSPTCSK